MQSFYSKRMLSEKPITSVYSWFTSCNLNNWSVNLRIYSVIALTTTAHSIKYTCLPFVIKELITFFWYLFLREVNTKSLSQSNGNFIIPMKFRGVYNVIKSFFFPGQLHIFDLEFCLVQNFLNSLSTAV